MQWVKDPTQINVYYLNNIIHEDNRHFREKKKTYPKAKSEQLETNVRSKILRHV